MLGLEAASFDATVVLAARLSTRALDAHVALLQVCGWTFISGALAVSIAATVRVGHLLGARELGLMRPTAWLINISRGGVVDEPALIAALQAPSASATCPLPRPPPPSPVTGLLRTPATSPALT